MNLLLLAPGESPLAILETRLGSSPSDPIRPSRWARLRRQTQEMYAKLKEKLPYSEILCSHLRHVEALDVYHPTRWEPSRAERIFRDFLQLRYHKHGRWLWIDSILAGLGIFLMPLPGPNIFFYYPAARSMGHLLAWRGAAHALGLERIRYSAHPLVERLERGLGISPLDPALIREVEERFHIENLALILGRLRIQ